MVVTKAIAEDKLIGTVKLALTCEGCTYYHGIYSNASGNQNQMHPASKNKLRYLSD